MNKYYECRNIAILNGFTETYLPVHIKRYLAYKDGECRGFIDAADARSFSKLVEEVNANQEAIDAAQVQRNAFYAEVNRIWFEQLHTEYKELVELNVFDIIYQRAYLDEKNYGPDEVFRRFKQLAAMSFDIIERLDSKTEHKGSVHG
jgi:hypothetical protein